MKKAVINTGGKQYLVSEGETVSVELLKSDAKTATFVPLLIIDDTKVIVGKPDISGAKVTATIESADEQGDKVTSIRYKSKKRVHTVRGHRQRTTNLKISKIDTSSK
jgi:large subunit ribosomal protein L21